MDYQNVYTNAVTGATTNPVMENPDAIDDEFALAANRVLERAVEVVRYLVGAHQSAAAIVVQNDWTSIRKFFSLSEKYAAWKDYKTRIGAYCNCPTSTRVTLPTMMKSSLRALPS